LKVGYSEEIRAVARNVGVECLWESHFRLSLQFLAMQFIYERDEAPYIPYLDSELRSPSRLLIFYRLASMTASVLVQ
jgi:hypothetical protein